jgi:LytS/YehU family sensor histidine kinase
VGTHPEQHAGDAGWCRFYCPQPFIVHSQETAYLICERRRERDERSGLELARAKAELAALTAQVDPHFVFNSLHTIIELNQESPELATEFAVALADVYRYVVQHGKRDLVPLAEELGLLEKYALLLRTRFGDGISVRLPKPVPHHRDLRIPPVSLQVLVENAIKHNRYMDRTPLEVWVELKGRSVAVRNQKRPLPKPSRGTHTGLINRDQRCKLICGPGIEIQEDGASFAVVVPLL